MTSILSAHPPVDRSERAVEAYLALLDADFDVRTRAMDAALVERAKALVAGAAVDLDEVLSSGNE